MTELIWDGKYDREGRKTAPLRVPLSFQTVETVNESAQQRQRTLDIFSEGRQPEWRNRLIWGDKKYVLPSLLKEFAGKVDLIYIDPPFDTGADFSFSATVPLRPAVEGENIDGNEEITFIKQPSIIEQKAYRDTWRRGLQSYLQWFYETAVLLRDLLSKSGSLYVHLDYTDATCNLRYYEPDFVVLLADQTHYLIETKGREDIDVAHKDRAARIWCENALRSGHLR